MCCHHRHSGIGLIVVGLIVVACGALHHFHGDCRRAEFERHVAEVCVKAAAQVQK